MGVKLTLSEFITRARGAHGDKYDYSKIIYKNNSTKVSIGCPEHGDFFQEPGNHCRGHGCPKCGIDSRALKRRLDHKDLLKKFARSHGDKYDYSQVIHVNTKTEISIICGIHGEFKQTSETHASGHGCPACGGIKRVEKGTRTQEQAVASFCSTHGGRYDYSKVRYEHNADKVTIICKKHGEFKQAPSEHTYGKGCPACGACMSKNETAIYQYLKNLGFDVEQRDRKLIPPLELDIVIPSARVAIEYNGLIWHSEKFGKGREYHQNKMQRCKDAGYRLINIWEDDYNRDPGKELGFITHVLGATKTSRVYARNTKIRDIGHDEAVAFLDKWHVQGGGPGFFRLGAFYGGELVAVTIFKRRHGGGYELTRHATSVSVLGSLGKAVKYFSKRHRGAIVSFCDLSRFTGASYLAAGFKQVGVLRPDYSYLENKKRKHKFGFRRADIKRKYPEVFDPESTEREMMLLAGIHRIWDCGKIRFEYA